MTEFLVGSLKLLELGAATREEVQSWLIKRHALIENEDQLGLQILSLSPSSLDELRPLLSLWVDKAGLSASRISQAGATAFLVDLWVTGEVCLSDVLSRVLSFLQVENLSVPDPLLAVYADADLLDDLTIGEAEAWRTIATDLLAVGAEQD